VIIHLTFIQEKTMHLALEPVYSVHLFICRSMKDKKHDIKNITSDTKNITSVT